MSEQLAKVTPAQLGFLAIYNPSLGTTDETFENQIVYYSSSETRGDVSPQKGLSDTKAIEDAIREQSNERLRQIGLAQGMVEFGRSFSEGRSVDTIETEKSRIILHELEAGWWILASINLTILPATVKTPATKGKIAEQTATAEYSSREVKPPILLLGDLLQAHSTFLLHHASSMSALFVRTRRSKFVGLLGRYWDTFLSTWNVLMHGNPANKLYGAIKVAACGELGVGVGEEERGSGEREVLEGFVGRVDGLIDVIVSKFGDTDQMVDKEQGRKKPDPAKPTGPWLGSGDEPAAEDGAIFLGTGALSRKSLRDVSHWVEDLYRWGPHAYGVIDNPSSNRRTKKSKTKSQATRKEVSAEAKQPLRQITGLTLRDKRNRQDSLKSLPPKPIEEGEDSPKHKIKDLRPSIKRGLSSRSFASTDSDSKTSKFASYLKFGYGTHWSLGGSSTKSEGQIDNRIAESTATQPTEPPGKDVFSSSPTRSPMYPSDDSEGHFLIGLMGGIDDDDDADEIADGDTDNFMRYGVETDGYNARLVLRTLTLELERAEDARAEGDISIDLGVNENDGHASSRHTGSERTGTSNTSFESQDRNKTKRLRAVVYVNKPFIFVFLFELRTDALALTSLYRSLHYQIGPLHKPLLKSTSYRASKPDIVVGGQEGAKTPIYDIVYDPKLLTINSTIPNIPDPYQIQPKSNISPPWSRIEALNTHMQIIQTYIATSVDRSELERTCKTSRGWWVVWNRVPDPDQSITLSSGSVDVPEPISEDGIQSMQSTVSSRGKFSSLTSHGTSTVGASMNSGPAHPFLETPSNTNLSLPKDKEIFLIRRASDYVPAKSSGRFASGSSMVTDAGWTAGPGKLAQGIGIDTKRYIEGLLNLNR
ncbi:hypothetical protein D0Z07_7718 [Hyphodiscus hymeniophilus]|uniref:CCZ1/INTU/HSP4 first Longin domain-containing protein n=1 Tax=Hyphodiscus hymeniophilus TaxID=353542 RepID=A0A9P6SKL3_9HELO|nr:hypothetical protein D0Z07_7718 [Hyphodiscus hymeniophilus]